MSPVLKRTGVLLGSLALAVYAAACDTGTGPAGNFDPQTTAVTVDQVVQAFQANDAAFTSMSLATPSLGASMAAQMLPKEPGQILPKAADVPAIVKDLTVEAIFPSNYLGKTFVYDTAQGMYVASDTATGAPTNGVRVIYYAIDPVSRTPAQPLNALGYIDLTDESTASSVRLGIKIVQTGDTDVTLADYYVDVAYTQTQTETSAQLSSVGYVSNGTDELDFDLSETATLSSSAMTMTMDYQLSLANEGVSVRFQGSGSVDQQSGAMGAMEATFTLDNGTDQVVLNATIAADNTVDGTLKFNGSTVMNIGGTSDSPTFTKADGSALTQSDVTALQNIWNSIGDLFTFVGNLFGPAGG
ncbi:MAG: hypothetical protein P8099_06800 [Gemmatimonadota bacterium]|jgi:hypothetical protein